MVETTVPAKEQRTTELTTTREDSRYLAPPVDIYETDEGLTVVADLPGVKKEELSIRVENDTLTIEGRPAYELHGSPVLEEFDLLRFFRQFELTDQVDQDRIQAEFKSGVLTVRLPKVEKAKPRRIEVKVE